MPQTEWVPENDADREWLGKQLAQWPTRVDEERTTNVTFLMSAAATELARLQSEVQALRVALGRLRTTAAMLQQNSEACAINHYGEDFDVHGMPGWLADTKKDISDALALLPTKDPAPAHR